jgi:hypothetical protein
LVHDWLINEGYRQIATSFDITGQGKIDAMVMRPSSDVIVGTRGAARGDDARGAAVNDAAREEIEALFTLTIEDEPVVLPQQAYGGMLLTWDKTSRCTSGFSVRSRANNAKMIVTAGHCGGYGWGINYIRHGGNKHPFTLYAGSHMGAYGDVTKFTTRKKEKPLFYYSSTGVRSVTSFKAKGTFSQNEKICVYGRSMTSANCTAVVASTNATCSYGGRTIKRLVQMNRAVTRTIDSGGPWFNGNKAYGITFGLCGGKSAFSQVAYFPSAVDVNIMLD